MKFYEIKEFNKFSNENILVFKSTNIDIIIMSKIFKSMEKGLTLDDTKDIFWSEKLNIFPSKVKKTKITYLLRDDNKSFFEYNDEKFFYKIINNDLIIAKSEEKINDYFEKSPVALYDKNVINWLDNGKTGLSSLTLCKYLYPELKHNKLLELDESYPFDFDDLKRCVLMLDSIPGSRNLLKKVNISKEWNNLINNWDKLENAMKSEDVLIRQKGKDLLNECIDRKKLKIK